jgi:hypothetical protein
MKSKNSWIYFLFILICTLPASAAFNRITFNQELTCNKRSTQGELKFIKGAPNGSYSANLDVENNYRSVTSIDGNSLSSSAFKKNFKVPQDESGLKFNIELSQDFFLELGSSFSPFSITVNASPGDDLTQSTGFGTATGTLTVNDSGCAETDTEDESVEVDEELVKIQPSTRNGSCPLTSLEHLNISIKTEQALKLRLDRQAKDILDAIDAIAEAGVNPGPAIRRLDALIAFIRRDIEETRNTTKGGLEFSKRHLVCAKQKVLEENLPFASKNSAVSEINQAIANDDEAIEAISTENQEINEEAVRLQGTLNSTSSKITFALLDKEQAGEAIDPSFTMPDFESEDVNDVFSDFQKRIAELAEELIEKLSAQTELLRDNKRNPAVDAILEVQNQDCLTEFFDEVVHEYTKLHTHIREELKKIAEAALAEEPEEDAPSKRVGREAEKETRVLDNSFNRTINTVNRTKDRYDDTYGGLVGTAQQRTVRKIQSLLQLLRRAELANDTQWRRLIRKELKKFAGFYGQGA